jgi:isocitrate dehydrogenase kinase/phosphatase
MGTRFSDRDAWERVRAEYAAQVSSRPDREIAETFFNSLTRRALATVGVDQSVEFTFPERRSVPRPSGAPPIVAAPATEDQLEHALELILREVTPFVEEPGSQARRAAQAIRNVVPPATLRSAQQVRVLAAPLFRNKGAYVTGQIDTQEQPVPITIALLRDAEGTYVDAVLTTADAISIVFGFSWSYLMCDIECPAAAVAYLASIMPHKRPDELYTSLGYNRHGKTELYRALLRHVASDTAEFHEAEGARGLVMTVFTLPELNVVFKLIRDGISPIKQTNRREVMNSYQFVFRRDRVGRLADAQEFEQLVVPRRCVPEALLAELTSAAPSNVEADEDHVVISHLYTQRRLRPLNLYLEEASEEDAASAVLDYGQAIKDLAAADIFPGDMLIKNCGVSRHGRVIFYDFDELSTLGDCSFRHLPVSSDADDELSAEPWFSVGEHDVFPEQFEPFLIPKGPLADLFRERHGEIFDPDWWRTMQEKIAAGEMFDTYPYAAQRRLPRNESGE